MHTLAETGDDASAERRAGVLWDLGRDLMKLGRVSAEAGQSNESWRCYTEAARHLREAETIRRRLGLAPAAVFEVAVDHGSVLIRLDRRVEAAGVLGRAITEVGVDGEVYVAASASPEIAAKLFSSIVGVWLDMLDPLERCEEAAAAADAVIAAFEPGTSEKRREVLASAYQTRAGATLARGDRAAALSALEEAIKRCDGEQGLGFMRTQAEAMGTRALLLSELGRTDEALAACDEVLARFGSVRNEEAQRAVTATRDVKAKLQTAHRPGRHEQHHASPDRRAVGRLRLTRRTRPDRLE